MKLSSLLQRINEPETIKMAKLARELRSQGVDIIDLSLGEPDFDTPEHIKEAAKKAIDENFTHYTPVAGIADLRKGITEKFKRDNNLEYAPENIVVSTGAKQSLANAIFSIVDKDDEVIIPTPYWVTYSELVKMAGGTCKFVRTSIDNNFKITADELQEALTSKTKAFLFSTPCNPTGSVYSREELQLLAQVFEKYPDVFIISDEIYEYINFVGGHESIAQFENIKDRVIIINGLSKGFAMTGWRLGYTASNVELAKACEKIQSQITSGTNSIAQVAAVTAVLGDKDSVENMRLEFERRRLRTVELAGRIPGFEVALPEGAFYIFPKVTSFFGKTDGKRTINNSTELSMYLLEVANVSSVTGDAFGEPDCIRFSYSNSMENLEKAFERIDKALAKLS